MTPVTMARCGPAGWSYAHWNGVVYPRQRPRGFHPLEFLAGCVDLVEVNTSFYQPLRPEVTRLWVKKVAHNRAFQFTVKIHRRFTHEREWDQNVVASFKDGLWPLLRSGRLGAVLLQFPWSFRFTAENREYLIALRRAFHEFPLVAEMRHNSWMLDEALGVLIDYRVGFVNIDQPGRASAMPATSFLTSPVGYFRLHGRSGGYWREEFGERPLQMGGNRYLYSAAELEEWRERIERVRACAKDVYVVTTNDGEGAAVLNALEMGTLLGRVPGEAPVELMKRYPERLEGFRCERPIQHCLFREVA
jgi:uncharacterized protein YecE (DUF72 family)